MHPALSVIFFTTASGAGYGILIILAMMASWQVVPMDRTLGMTGLGLAFILVTAGLLSSTFHLGHPERAWRALTQWRSSWLSREGVLSVLTYGPWLALAYYWIVLGEMTGLGGVFAGMSVALAIATVFCTAMIYRSLTTVHQWANRWTVPVYLMLAVASGAVWVGALLSATVGVDKSYLAFAVVCLLVAWRVKRMYWRFIDTTRHPSTPKSATGLAGDSVRLLEGPHTEENYLLQEMGYKVARKHAQKLRRFVHVFGFMAPILLLIAAYLLSGPAIIGACLAAAVSMSAGVVVERWLFFAEARHVVTLYYGAEAA
ncbi:MAG: dimethyl sulfoxide reductase anchor subunit [Rhodospirillales bacterium]|nr:dimethyl sulfoxide reductase anchor subunit [Rhodospirillales bacterium]MBO6786367.1 dimethyl sulfoxide reductase anchor subunit [Rhodospirillales bacterium]